MSTQRKGDMVISSKNLPTKSPNNDLVLYFLILWHMNLSLYYYIAYGIYATIRFTMYFAKAYTEREVELMDFDIKDKGE